MAFIQGTWYYNDPHIESMIGESFEEITWNFSQGTYEVYARCFVQQKHGGYQVIESQGDTLVLELFNPGTYTAERNSIRIPIDRANDTLSIQGAGPFSRLRP